MTYFVLSKFLVAFFLPMRISSKEGSEENGLNNMLVFEMCEYTNYVFNDISNDIIFLDVISKLGECAKFLYLYVCLNLVQYDQ